VLAPAAVPLLVAPAALAQGPAGAVVPDAQRNWLAEARESRVAAARTVAVVQVPRDVQPAFRFRA